jgi:hypothetical protein
MNQKIALVAASLFALLVTPAVFAGSQQERMKSCNAQAGERKGDERKAFMKECLSAKKATRQEKMKACNAQAGDKKGDERKDFMKECLKG